jgi:hypothetical protein
VYPFATLQLIVKDISDGKAKSQGLAVFTPNAGHVNDQAYNSDRNIATGNPNKKSMLKT